MLSFKNRGKNTKSFDTDYKYASKNLKKYQHEPLNGRKGGPKCS